MKHFKNLIIVTTSFILIGVACTPGDPLTTSLLGNWVKRIGFDGNGRAGAVSFVIGDSAYVGTGFDGINKLNDFWEFNPATNSWKQIANFGGTALPINMALNSRLSSGKA